MPDDPKSEVEDAPSGDEFAMGKGRGSGRRNTHSGRGGGAPAGAHKRRYSDAHHHKSKRNRFGDMIYPTGGNIRDPLNLSNVVPGMVDADPPKPPQKKDVPLKVKIPGTKHDPLNLMGGKQEEELAPPPPTVLDPIVSPIVRGMNSPLKKRQLLKKREDEERRSREEEKEKEKDKPGTSTLTPEEEKKRQNRERKEMYNRKYCYGNFDRYYGTRLGSNTQKDTRIVIFQYLLSAFKKEWFEKRTVLDIGCNVGFLTLQIAKEYGPRRILGIDIDEHLVGVARKNIRHYCDKDTPMAGKFPASFAEQFGPMSQNAISFTTKFPDNVWFRRENFVLESDELLELVEEDYDVILALSITKWIHLNWGDDGMRRFFKRCFRALRPGGRLILEPQAFSTYRKRSVMTEATKKNYKEIEFKPEDFEMYLMEECGFESVEHLEIPAAKSKGFQRPIDVYRKKLPTFLDKKKDKKESGDAKAKGDKDKKESGETTVSEGKEQKDSAKDDTKAEASKEE